MDAARRLMVLQPYEVILWGDRKDRPLDRIGVQAFSPDEARLAAIEQHRRRMLGRPHEEVKLVEVLSGSHLYSDPQRRKESLFEEVAEFVLGHSLDDIQEAAVDLLISAVQRRVVKLDEAERRWDELMGRGKVALQRRFRREAVGVQRDAKLEAEIVNRLGAQ